MSDRLNARRAMQWLIAVALISTAACISIDKRARTRSDRVREALIKEHRSRPDTAPKFASSAPNFKLKTLSGDAEVELASFRGEKPVVLVFGSYT